MIEIRPETAVAYLRRSGLIAADSAARAELLGGGVSNAVIRIDLPERSIVLKQARARLRTPAAWFSRLDRAWRECAALRALGEILGPQTVPEILWEDRENYAFVMAAAPPGALVWKDRLLRGETDPALAAESGRILGTIHERTRNVPELRERFGDREVFVQLRVDPYYRRLQEVHPALQRPLAGLIEGMLATETSLVHADYSPKNMLVSNGGIFLVDFETVHYGDPAFDVGFFLSHLVLKAFKNQPIGERYLDLTRRFWAAYHAKAGASLPADFESRVIPHFAACALARIDGTSQVEYLPEAPKRAAIRGLTADLLNEPAQSWAETLDRVRGWLALSGKHEEESG